uniref:Uncharacterized protein n=1 Tax=Rhizophora mucronata TaxID=61149 RepID=A0A2P2N0P2_RHIMU
MSKTLWAASLGLQKAKQHYNTHESQEYLRMKCNNVLTKYLSLLLSCFQ